MPRIERIPCGLIVVVWVSNSHSPAFPLAWEPSTDLIYTPVSLKKRIWDRLGSLWVVVDKGMCLQQCRVRVLGGNWVLGWFVRSGFLQVLGGGFVTFCKRICIFSSAGWPICPPVTEPSHRNFLKWRGFLSSPLMGEERQQRNILSCLLGKFPTYFPVLSTHAVVWVRLCSAWSCTYDLFCLLSSIIPLPRETRGVHWLDSLKYIASTWLCCSKLLT